MKRLKKKLRKVRKKGRRRAGRKRRNSHSKRRTSRAFKGIVDRAKAIETLVRHTISPELWSALPLGIRIEAYNRANGDVWDAIHASLDYGYSHLLGQLREGDGKAAWDRLVRLHAESSHGAQSHYLAMLMNCKYKHVVGKSFGGIRLYAEALQRINKLYKLTSGAFVQPNILMTKLLSLPSPYDYIVDILESTIAADRSCANCSAADLHAWHLNATIRRYYVPWPRSNGRHAARHRCAPLPLLHTCVG